MFYYKEKRRSNRQNAKADQIAEQFTYCHCCKNVDTTNNMVTCRSEICKESFCFTCCKNQQLQNNSRNFSFLKCQEQLRKYI